MSSQFDCIGQQLKKSVLSVFQLKNQRITEENYKIKNELDSMSDRINSLEQKALKWNIENGWCTWNLFKHHWKN